MNATTQPVAGWYRDPSRRHEHRWWDGRAWTPHVMTLGLRSIDYGDEAPAPAVIAVETPVRAEDDEVEEDRSVAVSGAEVARGPQWSLAVLVTVVVGAGVLAVGAMLPWAEASSSVASFSRAGIDGNGGATLAAAIGIALLCIIGPRRRLAAVGMIAMAAFAGALGANDALDISDKADAVMRQAPAIDAGVGVGLWLSLAGAAIALVGSVLALVAARRT
jgi:hypothetical protein